MSKVLSDQLKDESVECAQQIAKYAFMLSFALSFPKDHALIAHNRENLRLFTNRLLELSDLQ